MSLAIQSAKNVVIKNFSVIQPQFWASIVIDSEDVVIQDFYVNATSYNPAATYDRKSWLEVGCPSHFVIIRFELMRSEH